MSIRLNRIFQNTSIAVLQNTFNIIVSVFVNGYIAGRLGTGEYGKFVFAFAFPQLFSVIADFGLQGYYTKKISGNHGKTSSYLGEMVLIRIALAVLAIFSTIVALASTGHSHDTKKAVIIGTLAVLIAQTLFTNAWAVFLAHEDVKYIAVSNILSRVLVATLSIVVLQMGGGMIEVTWVYTLGYTVQVVYCFFILRKERWCPVFKISYRDVAGILKEALPFSLFTIFSLFLLQIDKTMLSLINGDASLGIYNAASSLCTNSTMISVAVVNAVFPTLVQSFQQNKFKEFTKKIETILKWMLIMGIPLAMVIAFYAQEIILFIYRNEKYEPSVLVLQILIWMLPIDLLSRLFRYALIAGDKEHSVTWYYGFGLAMNVLLNLFLIPSYSFIGAAIASIISQTFLVIVQGKHYIQWSSKGIALPYFRLLIGNTTLFAVLFMWNTKVYWMAGILMSIAFFAMQMVVLGVVKRNDFRAIFSGN